MQRVQVGHNYVGCPRGGNGKGHRCDGVAVVKLSYEEYAHILVNGGTRNVTGNCGHTFVAEFRPSRTKEENKPRT